MKKSNDAQGIWKVIGASSVGTLIEWYDFYIFGSLATVIARQFFPQTNPTAALLSTLATFAAGFIVRPFGALVFGRLGDLVGRRPRSLLPKYWFCCADHSTCSPASSGFGTGGRIRRSRYLCGRTRTCQPKRLFHVLDPDHCHAGVICFTGRDSAHPPRTGCRSAAID